LAPPSFRFAMNNQCKTNMIALFFSRTNTRFSAKTRNWKPFILLLFISTISCRNKESSKTIQIEFASPVHGYNVTIYWKPKFFKTNRADEDRKRVVGKATLELERIADKVKYKADYNLSIDTLLDSDFKESVYESFVNQNFPRAITINNKANKNRNKEDSLFYDRNEAFFFFKDVNFDDKNELLLVEESLEAVDEYKVFRVFEFQNDKLVEFQYFPPLVFAYSSNYVGKIDYAKKETSVSSYYSCCEYDTDFYRLDRNFKNKFVLYKTEKINWNKPIITNYYKE
jgi:hypothetical protein